MKIVLTGGHLAPALALIPRLRQKHEILFIGRKHAFEGDWAISFEYETIKKLGVDFESILAGRLQRQATLYTIPAVVKFPIGFVQSLFLLIRYKPDVVLSFGGYVGLAVCLASWVLGIPIVVHEQTMQAGLANRIIGFFARRICITFQDSASFFAHTKIVLTGNPMREELFTVAKKSRTSFEVLYITGGSGGSHSINLLIQRVLRGLLEKYIVIHQTGYRDYEILAKVVKNLPKEYQTRYIVKTFFKTYELAWIYTNATLLVGRSGANTVYEILTFGIPSLLIPLPWAASSEQEVNAKLVQSLGLGKMLKQEGLTSERLLSEINNMIENSKMYKTHAALAARYIIPDAASRIVAVLESVFDEKRKHRW